VCIDEVKQRKAWQPDDAICLIFHVFKALKDTEADAVKSLVNGLRAEFRSGGVRVRPRRRRARLIPVRHHRAGCRQRHHAVGTSSAEGPVRATPRARRAGQPD
jgi:hypothetical protein